MIRILSDFCSTFFLTGINTYKKHEKHGTHKLDLVLSNITFHTINVYKNLSIYFTINNEVYFKIDNFNKDEYEEFIDNNFIKFNLPFDEITYFNKKIVWSYNNYYYSHSVKDLKNINTNYKRDEIQYDKIKLNVEWLYFEKDGVKLLNYAYYYSLPKLKSIGFKPIEDDRLSELKSIGFNQIENKIEFAELSEDILDIVYLVVPEGKFDCTLIYYKNKIVVLYECDYYATINVNYKFKGFVNEHLLLKRDNEYYVFIFYGNFIVDFEYLFAYGIDFDVVNKKLFIKNKETTIYEFIEFLKSYNKTELCYLNIDDFDIDKQDIQKLIYINTKIYIVKQNTLYEYHEGKETIHYDVKFPIKIKKSSN